MIPGTVKNKWSTIISRGILFTLIWWVLTDGTVSSWWIGGPAVVLAVAVGTALIPPVPFMWRRFLRFMPFFFWRSLLGGVDVAWRAFRPSLPIAPTLIDYPLRLPPGLPRIFMANMVSLLPGTLSAALHDNVLTVHVLDRRQDNLAELRAVEHSVARMFKTSLTFS